jgi:hypothetical protein
MKWLTAPEYLYVHNLMDAYDEGGDSYKNRNHLYIPEILDVTANMTSGNRMLAEHANVMKVEYALKYVIYHANDSLNVGHYIADITQMPQSFLNENPEDKESDEQVDECFCDDTVISNMRNIVRGVVDGVNVLTVSSVKISAKTTKRTPFDM